MKMPLPAVAKCNKCGREFLTLPANGDYTDHFFPQGTSFSTVKSGEARACGGEIVPISPPADTGSVT